MMNNYTIKKPENNNFLYTRSTNNEKNCTKISRCNNPKICKKCNSIYQYKIKDKLTNHLEESILNNFTHKYFIRFKNDDLEMNVIEKNSTVNLFMKDFIKMKRNKNFVICKDDEYIINKEISFSHDLGYNPHFHMILLTNNTFDINNSQFIDLCNRYNISIHVKDIYKVDNSYKQSIINILGYMNKFDKHTSQVEKESKILHNEKKNFNTNLFKKKKYNKTKSKIFYKFIFALSVKIVIVNDYLSKSLYIKIMKKLKTEWNEAKAIFRRNTKKTSPKNYIRMLKSLKKKKNLLISKRARLYLSSR